MHFATEQLIDKLGISAEKLSEFEQKGIVQGISKAGRVFYSSRDMYRLKGILLLMARGLPLDEARRRVDQPTQEVSSSENRV